MSELLKIQGILECLRDWESASQPLGHTLGSGMGAASPLHKC